MFGSGGYRERATYIIIDPFRDCMCFVLPIMECGFCVLPQGIPFTYILLVKLSFREASGYLLHNLEERHIQRSPRKNLHRCNHAENQTRNLVMQIDSCVTCLYPQYSGRHL